MAKKVNKNKDQQVNMDQNRPENEVAGASTDGLEQEGAPVAEGTCTGNGSSCSSEQQQCDSEAIKTAEHDEIESLKGRIDELNDRYLRLSAEFDNYRKRTLKEKMELTKTAGEKITLGLLPVADDFDRALEHINSATDLGAVKEGVELIRNNFSLFLSRHGVKEIETVNQPFDIDLHEAVTKMSAPSEDFKGKILYCVQKGYILEGKVIRFPKVVVGD